MPGEFHTDAQQAAPPGKVGMGCALRARKIRLSAATAGCSLVVHALCIGLLLHAFGSPAATRLATTQVLNVERHEVENAADPDVEVPRPPELPPVAESPLLPPPDLGLENASPAPEPQPEVAPVADRPARPRQPLPRPLQMPVRDAPPRPVEPVAGQPVELKPQTTPAPQALPRPVETEPRAKSSNPKPRYPKLAQRRGYQGSTVLHVEVSKDGKAIKVDVQRSSGFAVLDDAALNAVKDWVFEPGTRDGNPVAGSTEVTIRFEINDS